MMVPEDYFEWAASRETATEVREVIGEAVCHGCGAVADVKPGPHGKPLCVDCGGGLTDGAGI